MSVCTSIEKVTTGDETSLLKVTIDNSIEAYWFYDYGDAMQYVGQEVIVEYRKDIYRGNMCQFIKTFVIPTSVSTLDKKENIKLYCDQLDNFASLSFSEIADGETREGCVVFCVAQEFRSSGNATWQQLTIRDRTMHIATLRLFNYSNPDANFAGSYIKTELSRNQYGFKSEFIVPVGGECPENPEITIAKQFISNYFSSNPVGLDFMSKTNLIGFLEEAVDYEKGYGIVRLAMELAMVDSMQNITKDVDLDAIGCALLASRAHFTRTSSLSDSVNNVIIASNYPWNNRKVVVQLLDVALEEKPAEHFVYESIQKTVDNILKIRKGFAE